jgi:hypothetical protein
MHAGILQAAKSNLSSNSNTRTAYNLSRSITSQSHSWQRDFSLFSLARSPFGLTREKLLRQILLRPQGIAFVCNSKMIPPGRDATLTDDRTSTPQARTKKVLPTTLCQWAENRV